MQHVKGQKKMSPQLGVEAVVVGITVVIFWLFANFLASAFSLSYVKNIDVTFIGVLFATGVFSHLFFEFAGANKWYCKNGHACQ